MLFDLFRIGAMTSEARMALIMNACARIFVIFCVLPIHEFAHAFVAHKLGDDTAKLKGRLTVAPMAHIDPIGALMIFLVGFGYAKPVPVNMRNFRKKRKDADTSNVYYMGGGTTYDSGYAKRCMALVGFAGPLSNIIMAIVALLLSHCVLAFFAYSNLVIILYYFLYYCATVNISLAVFNLIPIPPLDGSRILSVILPDSVYYKIMQYERYIMIGVLILLMTGALSRPLGLLVNVIYKGLNFITGLPFGL